MTDVENLLTQLWDPDTRPLAEGGVAVLQLRSNPCEHRRDLDSDHRRYHYELTQLADDGDPGAVAFRAHVANA